MAATLYELLKRDIKKMVSGLGSRDRGNIYPLVMQEIERYIISLVLEETNYNHLRAARTLGISRSTLYRKLECLGLVENGVPVSREQAVEYK